MVLSPQGYMIEISSMQQLENFNSSTTRSYLAAVLMYDNVMVVLEFYVVSDSIQSILIAQLEICENYLIFCKKAGGRVVNSECFSITCTFLKVI